MDGSTLVEGTLLRVMRKASMSPGIKYTPLPKSFTDGLNQPFLTIDKDEQVVYLGERHRVQVGDDLDGNPAMYDVVRVFTSHGPMWMSETDLEET